MMRIQHGFPFQLSVKENYASDWLKINLKNKTNLAALSNAGSPIYVCPVSLNAIGTHEDSISSKVYMNNCVDYLQSCETPFV